MNEVLVVHDRTMVTTKKIASRHGISHMTLKRWRERGLIPAPAKLGRRLYYDLAAVERRINEGE